MAHRVRTNDRDARSAYGSGGRRVGWTFESPRQRSDLILRLRDVGFQEDALFEQLEVFLLPLRERILGRAEAVAKLDALVQELAAAIDGGLAPAIPDLERAVYELQSEGADGRARRRDDAIAGVKWIFEHCCWASQSAGSPKRRPRRTSLRTAPPAGRTRPSPGAPPARPRPSRRPRRKSAGIGIGAPPARPTGPGRSAPEPAPRCDPAQLVRRGSTRRRATLGRR